RAPEQLPRSTRLRRRPRSNRDARIERQVKLLLTIHVRPRGRRTSFPRRCPGAELLGWLGSSGRWRYANRYRGPPTPCWHKRELAGKSPTRTIGAARGGTTKASRRSCRKCYPERP